MCDTSREKSQHKRKRSFEYSNKNVVKTTEYRIKSIKIVFLFGVLKRGSKCDLNCRLTELWSELYTYFKTNWSIILRVQHCDTFKNSLQYEVFLSLKKSYGEEDEVSSLKKKLKWTGRGIRTQPIAATTHQSAPPMEEVEKFSKWKNFKKFFLFQMS